jgi:putative hydrolase of the HAD superfamily
MSTVLVFDLDDTLYDEQTFVESGFRAVARFGATEFGWDPESSFNFMVETLQKEGRGFVFNRWLEAFGRPRKVLVKRCVNQYRKHSPELQIFKETQLLLPRVQGFSRYIVTDGNKWVQRRKVQALDLAPHFRGIYITHQYGVKHAKPSSYCFDLIRKRELCDWKNILYVGDNPTKDFFGLNKLGAKTVRVLTGRHRGVIAAPGYDAQVTIPNLNYLLDVPGLLLHSPS